MSDVLRDINLKPLTSHATPYSLARTQGVPPGLRKKSHWYRNQMDPRIENDTRELHWTLSPPESRRLLEAIFPDTALFPGSPESLDMTQLLDSLRKLGVYARSDDNEPEGTECWRQTSPRTDESAESITARFFNGILQAVKRVNKAFTTQRRWHADGATSPLKGSDANRKPDLVLLSGSLAKSSEELDWRDVIVFGEIKSQKTSDTLKKSYIEAAGKTALLLYAQDGRHSAPCLRMLGQHIVLTFFDRGGSLSTAPFDIHENPEIFLRILLGLSTIPKPNIGFDETMFWESDEKKRVLVAWKGDTENDDEGNPIIHLEQLIFISDALHSRGTTVWSGSMWHPSYKSPVQVVVKDSWIDPLRKFTEGALLARLNDAGVEGVPLLIHEQQVQGPHPSRPGVKMNMSTHYLRTVLSLSYGRAYQLRVLSRLVTEPFGISIMSFSSLAELLVAFIDYVSIHEDAIFKAKVLHRDISLLNLLLVLWDSSGDGNRRLDFLDNLPPDTRTRLRAKMKDITYRGLLADWGYAVPLDAPCIGAESAYASQSSPPLSPCNLPPTSPITPPSQPSSEIGEDSVPVRVSVHGQDRIERIPLSELKLDHEIVLSMGRDHPPDYSQPSIDTNPLYRTGTWSWMAAELVMAGPGKPVTHTASHDLESLFYVLLGICVLFDTPHCLKPERALSECFDIYFNTFEPSLLKTVTIQSEFGWRYQILEHISPYFQPLIPLLETLRERIILPISFKNKLFHVDRPITHAEMRNALVEALSNIEDEGWVHTRRTDKAQAVVNTRPSRSSKKPQWDPYDNFFDESDSYAESHIDPRMPRPIPVRQVSGPGFTASASSGSTRKQLDDDADYPDPDSRASKRPRPTLPRREARLDPRQTRPMTRRFAATAPPM